jgi:thymidylate synthase (FAD)
MDCWRQWIRHRTANVNEYSTRYSEAIDSAQKTKAIDWRVQAKNTKQGSEGNLSKDIGKSLSKKEKEFHKLARNLYRERLEIGVAREQARKDLPLSTYTEAYWKTDLHNLLHFLELRMSPHSQVEIRSYASIIGYEIVKNWCSITWEAFQDYRLNSLFLTGPDQEIIRAILNSDFDSAINFSKKVGFIKDSHDGIKRNRECIELEQKLIKLNLPIPWLKNL